MRRLLFIYVIALGALLLSCGLSLVDSLEFQLQPGMVQSAKILKTKHGYEALFRLAEPYSSEFATLTRENIGRHLTMRYKGRVIASAGIQGEITGGAFTGGVFPTHQEAEAFIREVIPGVGEIPKYGSSRLDPLEFDLQPGMLQSASILQTSSGHEVLFRFAKEHRPLFANLTRGNVGRRLIMHYNGRAIASMDIQGEIIDGVFTGGVFSTQREAEAFIHEAAPGIKVMAEH